MCIICRVFLSENGSRPPAWRQVSPLFLPCRTKERSTDQLLVCFLIEVVPVEELEIISSYFSDLPMWVNTLGFNSLYGNFVTIYIFLQKSNFCSFHSVSFRSLIFTHLIGKENVCLCITGDSRLFVGSRLSPTWFWNPCLSKALLSWLERMGKRTTQLSYLTRVVHPTAQRCGWAAVTLVADGWCYCCKTVQRVGLVMTHMHWI